MRDGLTQREIEIINAAIEKRREIVIKTTASGYGIFIQSLQKISEHKEK